MSDGWTEEDDALLRIEMLTFHGAAAIEQPTCSECGTAITRRPGVGWTHDLGFKARGGCYHAVP